MATLLHCFSKTRTSEIYLYFICKLIQRTILSNHTTQSYYVESTFTDLSRAHAIRRHRLSKERSGTLHEPTGPSFLHQTCTFWPRVDDISKQEVYLLPHSRENLDFESFPLCTSHFVAYIISSVPGLRNPQILSLFTVNFLKAFSDKDFPSNKNHQPVYLDDQLSANQQVD